MSQNPFLAQGQGPTLDLSAFTQRPNAPQPQQTNPTQQQQQQQTTHHQNALANDRTQLPQTPTNTAFSADQSGQHIDTRPPQPRANTAGLDPITAGQFHPSNDPFASPLASQPFNPAGGDSGKLVPDGSLTASQPDPFAPPPQANAAAPDPFARGAFDPFTQPQQAQGSAAAQLDPFAQPAAAQDELDLSAFAPPGAEAEADADADDTDDVEEVPAMQIGLSDPNAGDANGAADSGGETVVLSRQDTWKYLSELAEGGPAQRAAAARALKHLAFNSSAEYKSGLIKGGFFRGLMRMLQSEADADAWEHVASCMYSMGREHQPSKLELLRLFAHRRLLELLTTESAQLRLNCCAALYAISCAGRSHCKEIVAYDPTPMLLPMLEPGVGRTQRDYQLQLFAALFMVNIIYAKGIMVPKERRPAVRAGLMRAYDDAQEEQARSIITLGLKKLHRMDSRKAAVKKTVRSARKSVIKGLKRVF